MIVYLDCFFSHASFINIAIYFESFFNNSSVLDCTHFLANFSNREILGLRLNDLKANETT